MEVNKSTLSEKEEIIGRLYALRAGLSVIAQERETADGIMQKAYNDKEMAVAVADRTISMGEQHVHEQKEVSKSFDSDRTSLLKKANSPNITQRVLITLLQCLVWLVFAAAIIYGIYAIANAFLFLYLKPDIANRNFNGWLGWMNYTGPYAFIIVGGAIAGLGVFARKFTRFLQKKKVCSYSEKKEAEAELVRLEHRIKQHDDYIRNAEEEVRRARDKKWEDLAAQDENIAKAKKEATEHAVAGLSMIYALEESFGDLIDSRDWENTDIIIYALETRRADNIMQALQVVDGERRTERIIQAVDTAGREICKSINMGLSRLQSEMTRCFGILGQLVVKQGDRIAGRIQDLQYNVSSSMSQLASQQTMSNALLAKANENSAVLAAEAVRLRTAAEYADARTVYNGY